jgi:1,4-alpha-glucan branching enzyme
MARKSKQKMTAIDISRLTTFRLCVPDAREVKLAGDFNNWQPEAMARSRGERGSWEVLLDLKPGTYQYKFVVDGDWRHDPACADTVCNEFGSLNSVARVG